MVWMIAQVGGGCKEGTLGLLAPDPRQRAAWPSGLPFGGIGAGSKGPARGGRAGLGGHGAQRVRRDAEHAGLPLSVTATAVTPSPPGKGASPLFMRALGRGSPTVAPLRVGLRAPSWSREAATSCGGRRRLLGLLRPWGGDGDMLQARSPGFGAGSPGSGGPGGNAPWRSARLRRGAPVAHRDPSLRGAPSARRARVTA